MLLIGYFWCRRFEPELLQGFHGMALLGLRLETFFQWNTFQFSMSKCIIEHDPLALKLTASCNQSINLFTMIRRGWKSFMWQQERFYQTTLVPNGNPKPRITPVNIHAGSSLLGVLWAETAIHQANKFVCLMIVCFWPRSSEQRTSRVYVAHNRVCRKKLCVTRRPSRLRVFVKNYASWLFQC